MADDSKKQDTSGQAQEQQEQMVLCYWCLGVGQVQAGVTATMQPKMRRCSHCKGSGTIPASTPFPAAPATVATTAKATEPKPIGKGRASSGSRTAKKKAKKASHATTRKAAAK